MTANMPTIEVQGKNPVEYIDSYRRHVWQCVGVMSMFDQSIMLSSSLISNFTKGEAYYKRFLLPAIEKAIQLGIPMDKIDEMLDTAYEKSTAENPFGSYFKDMVDNYDG